MLRFVCRVRVAVLLGGLGFGVLTSHGAVIYRDTFGLDSSNGRVAGANLNGLPVETSNVGPTNWTSRDLYQSGRFTLAQFTPNAVNANPEHSSALATLPTSLGLARYYVEATIFPQLAGGTPGYLGVGFFRGTGGSVIWQNGLSALFLIVESDGDVYLNGSSVGGSLITLAHTVTSFSSSFLVRLEWDTATNLATAYVNGSTVASNLDLTPYGVNANSVTHVGVPRDGTLGINSNFDNFEFGTAPQSVPEPFTMALMGGGALAGFRRLRMKSKSDSSARQKP